jgi:Ca-activated chloride channel family protein
MSSIHLGDLVLLRPLWLIAAIVLMIAAIRWHRVPMGSDWKKVLSAPVFNYLHGADRKDTKGNLPLWAAALISLALAQPAIRKTDDETWRHSIGWIAVVDVSRSMTLDDIVPYRLSAAREALATLSRESGARPIALVVYAGDAYLVAPPAFDKSMFDEHAALLAYNIIPTDGSNLARALSLTSSVVADSQFHVLDRADRSRRLGFPESHGGPFESAV